MSITQFSDGVEVNGSQDVTQLKVQGHTTQTEPLQTWEDSAAGGLAQISGDGRFIVGDDLGATTPDALIEAHRLDSSLRPQRAFHALGQVAGLLSHTVQWVVQELEILGSGAVSGLQSTLRVRIRNATTGDASQAELLATDVEAVNESGSSSTRVGQITGLRTTVSNSHSGYVDQAIGLDVAVNNTNPDVQNVPINTAYGIRVQNVDQADANYAIHTGTGVVHVEDAIELKAPTSVPGTPATSHVRLYVKSDGKLYAKTDDGSEFRVSLGLTPQAGDEVKFLRGDGTWQDAGGAVESVGLSLPGEFTISGSPVTTNGTLTGQWASSTGNRVLASPNGGSGVPSFRSLVGADIPNLDTSKLTSGTLSPSRGGTGVSGPTANRLLLTNGTNAMNLLAPGSSGNFIRSNGTTFQSTGIQATDIPRIASIAYLKTNPLVSIGSGTTFNLIGFQDVIYYTDNMWTTSTRLTAQRDGWYMINAGIHIAGHQYASQGRRVLKIRLSGSYEIAGQTYDAAGGIDPQFYSVHTQRFLSAGQYIELLFYQNSGYELTLVGGLSHNQSATYLAMVRVS